MKVTFHILGLMLWLPTSYCGVIDIPVTAVTAGPKSKHANLHSTYTDLANGHVIELFVEGYEGAVTTTTLNQTFVPTLQYIGTRELAVRQLERRKDICEYFADCQGFLKDKVAYNAIHAYDQAISWCGTAATAMSTYYSANNYAHAYAVLDGAVSSIAMATPLAVAGYYLNARLDLLSGASSQDACGTTQAAVIAAQQSSSMYAFCVSLKNNAKADVATRYTNGDMSTPDVGFDSSDGRQMIANFNIGAVQSDTLAVCADYGVVWRRDLGAAVARGAQRQRAARRSLVREALE